MPSSRPFVASHVQGWTSVDLGDGVDAYSPTGKIQQAFMGLQLLGNTPPDAAVFSFYDLQKNVVTAYFSPAAEAIGRTFGATPCAPPTDQEGFSLLAGSAAARSLLFRE